MKRFAVLIIYLLLAFQLDSQAFISHSNYKYLISKDVFNTVTTAFGSSLVPPILEINNKDNAQKYIASYIPGNENLIVIDEELYDLATTCGSDSLNALAAIISHELAHHFQRHNFCSDFAFILGNENSLAKRITSIEKNLKVKVESEADYYGMFYGYVAGFNTFMTFSLMLDKIYSFYNLPEKIAGYPSKNERKEIAKATANKLKEWIAIFDAGELLFSLKKYSAAFTCFNKLVQVFPSREIINNAGVIRLYQAIDLLNPDQFPFVLPIEFDAATRLKRGIVRDINSDDEKVTRLIQSAITLFEKSIQIDPDYINSQVNLGCAYLLLKNYNLAIGISNKFLDDVKKRCDSRTISRIYTLRGLCFYYLGDMDKAKDDLVKAKNVDNNGFTGYNLLLYEKSQQGPLDQIYSKLSSLFKSQQPSAEKEGDLIKFYETIDKLNASSLNLQNQGQSINIENDNENIVIKYQNGYSYTQMAIASDAFQLNTIYTQFGYTRKTSGNIGLYDPENALLKAYGNPTYTIKAMTGEYFVYKKSKIIFYLNNSRKVNKWWIYQFN